MHRFGVVVNATNFNFKMGDVKLLDLGEVIEEEKSSGIETKDVFSFRHKPYRRQVSSYVNKNLLSSPLF